MPKIKKRAKKYFPFIFFTLITTISSIIYFRNLHANYYQCDEFSYLSKSRYFQYYINGDFTNRAWQENDAIDQTKLMEYIYWFPSKIISGTTFDNLAKQQSTQNNKYYDYSWWGNGYGKPLNQLPLTEELKNTVILGRKISTTLTVLYLFLAALTVFLIFKSYLLSIISFLFLITHPIISIHGRQVMADSALNLFFILSFLSTLYFYKTFWQNKKNKMLILSAFCGICAGLTTSTKLNGLLTFVFFLLVCFLTFIIAVFSKKKNKQLLKYLLLSTFVFISLSIIIFFLIHPTLWTKPISGIKRFFDWRIHITKFYQESSPHNSINNIFQAIYLVFLRSAGYLQGIGSIGFFFENEFGKQNPLPFLIINSTLFFLGLIYFVKNIIKNKGFLKSIQFLSFIWSFFMIFAVAFYLKLDWGRYYWPTFLPFLIVDFFGIKLIYNFFKKQK